MVVPKVGIYVNNRAAVFLADRFSVPSLLSLAREAEHSGFDFVSVGDSLLAKPRYSPVVILAAIAGQTDRIELTTGILQPHLRNPVLLAQEWATLDALSGGRTSIGVGLGTGPRGGVAAELAVAGLDHKTRARAFEEAIALLKELWKGGPVTFSGSVYRFSSVDIGISPVTPAGPKVLIACGAIVGQKAGVGPNDDVYRPGLGGTLLAPLARVARLGDGWITGMVTPAEWRDLWTRLCAEAGRLGRQLSEDSFERRLNCFIHVDRDPAAARAAGKSFLEGYHQLAMDDETLDRWLISGPPEQCAARISGYVQEGVNSFQFVLASERQHEQLERLANDVRPLLAAHSVASST